MIKTSSIFFHCVATVMSNIKQRKFVDAQRAIGSNLSAISLAPSSRHFNANSTQ